MLLAIRTNEDPLASEPKSLLAWLLPASVVLHAAAVSLMPNGTRRTALIPPPIVLEMAALPPPPAPPPPAPPPLEAPVPIHTAAAMPARAPMQVAAATGTPTTAAPPTPTEEAPVDFTFMTFSGDRPGVAVGASRASAPDRAPPVASALVVRVAAPPPVVPASSLGRPPRAPALDAELERNYPVDARRSGVSGTATLRVELLHDGRIGKVVPVSESYPGFGAACERTVRAGKWEPPIDREGRPVRTEIKYVCKFEVRS